MDKFEIGDKVGHKQGDGEIMVVIAKGRSLPMPCRPHGIAQYCLRSPEGDIMVANEDELFSVDNLLTECIVKTLQECLRSRKNEI